jgi:hypothetical protein
VPLLRFLLVGLVAVLLGAPAAALAQSTPPFGIGTITDNLAATGVAIDPEADVPAAQVRRFERSVEGMRAEGIPADVVVVQRQPLGAATFAYELNRARGYDGIQVVIVREPRSISFAAPGVYEFQDEHKALVEEASVTLPRDPVAAAESLAASGWELAQQKAEEYANRTSDSDDDSAARTAGRILGPILVLGVIVGVILLARRSRRRRRGAGGAGWGSSGSGSYRGRGAAMPDAVDPHEALDCLLDDLARRITELTPEVERPDAPEGARRAYADAVLAFGEGRDALPGATTTRKAKAVHADITRGLEAAERAQAILDGDRPGESRRGRR